MVIMDNVRPFRSRTPFGVRGQKCFTAVSMVISIVVALRLECVDRNAVISTGAKHINSRTPFGVRGQKFDPMGESTANPNVALRLECVDRNSITSTASSVNLSRTPFGVRGQKLLQQTRVEWEIGRTPFGVRGQKYKITPQIRKKQNVALRLECVDRNRSSCCRVAKAVYVALRLECVDRNSLKRLLTVPPSVALRLECVDRNIAVDVCKALDIKSHSVWSAWIEIQKLNVNGTVPKSHSVWSAWIEIGRTYSTRQTAICRTPFGVRGQK